VWLFVCISDAFSSKYVGSSVETQISVSGESVEYDIKRSTLYLLALCKYMIYSLLTCVSLSQVGFIRFTSCVWNLNEEKMLCW
jgi:hypothetical protein